MPVHTEKLLRAEICVERGIHRTEILPLRQNLWCPNQPSKALVEGEHVLKVQMRKAGSESSELFWSLQL